MICASSYSVVTGCSGRERERLAFDYRCHVVPTLRTSSERIIQVCILLQRRNSGPLQRLMKVSQQKHGVAVCSETHWDMCFGIPNIGHPQTVRILWSNKKKKKKRNPETKYI